MPIYVKFSAPISDSCEAESAQLIPTGTTAAPNGLRTRAQSDDITFVKKIDFLSAKLMMHTNNGTEFETVTIELRKQGHPTPYMIYTLSKTIIAGYSFSASRGSLPYETIGLNAESVRWRFFN
ncbi:hypothetical protein DK26_24350 [Bosea sp. WAO]|uniref:type VI secretion system tube protein Hcp n=1 Tax=Bosea sp. WAO TaxID=406341 RepID=UPI00074A2DA1|nr:type VI secretion system tube protein Hcp [Bosea sp. WAO]KUL93201.1 hypothetical protein DK26_24350 [Bosea sp. WAO]